MIWIIGVGNMGKEYAKVLDGLGIQYVAIGRGEKSAGEFETATGHKVIRGGLEDFLESKPEVASHAIVAVGVDLLARNAQMLIEYGVKNILIEKPGVGALSEINVLVDKCSEEDANVVLAYNRRFYSSVLKAEEIIAQDGGVTSFNFEFTEWAHTIDPKDYASITCEHWLLGNSSHVIDTAFFLGGTPVELATFQGGQNKIKWHPSGSIFAGAGVSDRGALFSYQANWGAPGRWVVEILTAKHRLYFKPMEALQMQEIGSVAVNPVEIDNKLDVDYKPGLYLQTKAFVEGHFERFCTVNQQAEHINKFYKQISGYTK